MDRNKQQSASSININISRVIGAVFLARGDDLPVVVVVVT
jgi:hypothetical protein